MASDGPNTSATQPPPARRLDELAHEIHALHVAGLHGRPQAADQAQKLADHCGQQRLQPGDAHELDVLLPAAHALGGVAGDLRRALQKLERFGRELVQAVLRDRKWRALPLMGQGGLRLLLLLRGRAQPNGSMLQIA